MTSYAFARFFAGFTVLMLGGAVWAAYSGQTWDVRAGWVVSAAVAALLSRAGSRAVKLTRRRLREERRRESGVSVAARHVSVRPDWHLLDGDGNEWPIIGVEVNQ